MARLSGVRRDENTFETVVAGKGDQFAMISVHQRLSFGFSVGRCLEVSSKASRSECKDVICARTQSTLSG
jgi:hypothetical protein